MRIPPPRHGAWRTLALCAMLCLPALARAQDVQVVAHAAAGVDALSAAEATKIFLKQASKFPNGTAAVPVDQKSAVKAAT